MENKLEQILEMYPDVEFLKADGFDKAVIGVDVKNYRLIYDYYLAIKVLIEDDGMTEEDAIEHFDFNVLGSLRDDSEYPIFIMTDFD
jgi:hypothetical protein